MEGNYVKDFCTGILCNARQDYAGHYETRCPRLFVRRNKWALRGRCINFSRYTKEGLFCSKAGKIRLLCRLILELPCVAVAFLYKHLKRRKLGPSRRSSVFGSSVGEIGSHGGPPHLRLKSTVIPSQERKDNPSYLEHCLFPSYR